MIVYRLSKKKYAGQLSGKGAARISGNRWNSKGTEIVYTAEHLSLALLEIFVHLPPSLIPKDYVLMEIEVPDDIKILNLRPNKLPGQWDRTPPVKETQRIGDDFIQTNKYCVMKVPSSIVSGKEYNLLLNPFHPDFARIKIVSVGPFLFDKRLFRKCPDKTGENRKD